MTEYNTTLLRHDEAWLRHTKFLRVACGTEKRPLRPVTLTHRSTTESPTMPLVEGQHAPGMDKGTSYPDAGTG